MAFGDITAEVEAEFAQYPPVYEYHEGLRIYNPVKKQGQMEAWRAANPLAVKVIARNYRHRNRAKYLAQKKAQGARYRAAHPDRCRESNRRSYLKRRAAGLTR